MNLPDQISPENLKQMRALLERMGSDVQPPDRSIRGLCQAHEELCGALKEFELEPAVLMISSMETIPELHANTIRIEILIHLAICSCQGTRRSTVEDLRSWLALVDSSPMACQEDPTEDVYVGYICTPDGGFRVYPGIFSNADFILERLLLFLEQKTNFPSFQEAYDSILELLKVSDAVADQLGHLRYSGSVSSPGSPIQVPGDNRIAKHAEAILFGRDRLSLLGIDVNKLGPFLFKPEDADDFESKPLFGSPLEHRPLLTSNDGFLVASPSCICRAAVAHILEVAPRLGGWADTFFEKENAEFFISEIVRRLEIQAMIGSKLPKAPENIPFMYPYVGQFDHGMAAISFVISSPISKGGDLEEVESFTDEQVADFTKYVGECCSVIETVVEGFRGGLILVAIAGIGRPVAFGLGDLRANWHFFSAGLADWQTISTDRDFTAKRLWYLGLQQDLAEKANIQFINTAGLLNLYAFWKRQDFFLVPKDINPKNAHNMVMIAENHAQPLNIQLKSTNDRHCCASPDQDGWILLQREGPSLNPDLSTNLRYCDYEAARQGRLRGCIERQTVAWWIEANIKPVNPDSSNLLYRMWDCVFHWLERILPVLFSEHPDWIPSSMRFTLDFPNVDDWDLQSATTPGERPLELDWEADPAAEVRLTFVEDFLRKFYRPDNLAEREIVAAVLRAAAQVAGATPSDSDIVECVERVVKGDGTRFFHVVNASTLESALSGPESADPALIPPEEIARIHLGLAYEVDAKPPKRITKPKNAQNFLKKVVAHLQTRLCSRLQQLEILPIVSYSFTQLDELSRDEDRWSLSTRALLTLEDGADWLYERLRLEKARITLAEIANRALIETAVYSYNPAATEMISQTEHASLLAEFAVMIELANHRDAIAYGFAPADITIQPNGTLEYDDTFQQEVFQPYLKSRIDDRIQWDSEAYDTYFGKPEPPENPPQEIPPEVASFEKSFHAEFGFSYDALNKVIEHFDEIAFAQGRSGGCLRSREIRWMLKEKVGLNDSQVDSFLERFVLPIRPKWDENLPLGCDANDVLPWRYYRGLSVLIRPFIEISQAPQKFAISAPHLHRWLRYLTHSITEGHLPARIFQSSEMESYLGSIADKKGHKFAEEVAELVKSILPDQRVEIKMTALGAPNHPDLGDVDVLAWDTKCGVVLLIECKRLKTALTVRQVIQQLENFRGDTANKEDALGKHKRRVDWLKQNPGELSRLTGIPADQISWKPLVVTRGRVPMSFIDAIDFSKDQVVTIQDLEDHVTSLIALDPQAQPLTSHPD